MNVVFTGEGIVSAIGNDKAQVLTSLRECSSGIGPMEYLPSRHKELPVGEVKLSNEDMKRMLNIQEQEVSRTVLMGILAVRQALQEAHITREEANNYRIVLISGTSVGGMDITELHFKGIEDLEDLDFLKHHDCGSSTQQIADYFKLFVEFTTISTACSSAANALIVGANMLKAGEADIVVAGGSEALTMFHLNGFNSLMILDHAPCRPFDNTRAGLNLGEGAAFVVMESEEQARMRHADIHAYLTGYGNACDAFHQTAFSDNGEGAYLAMKEALNTANVAPEDIQYVNAHGTGTPNNDECETIALQRIFGESMPLVSSTKSFTGHTTSASGSIEVIICLLAMMYRFVPANIGYAQPMPNGLTPTMGVNDIELKHILCNSFGFGGNDSSLVISNSPTKPNVQIDSIADEDIRVVAKDEIVSLEQLSDMYNYIKPLEGRRMGNLMKASLLTSLRVLHDAGVDRPDAIIMGTSYGCIENSEKLLKQMTEEEEGLLKPTFFMQSTHNTISSSVAIRTQCHGYNLTYTQGKQSLAWALRDARRLLKSGRYKTVLVGYHDESTPLFQSLFRRIGRQDVLSIHSISLLLSCGK